MLSKFCIPLNIIPLRHQQSLSVDTLTLHIFIGAGMKLSSMLLISSLLALPPATLAVEADLNQINISVTILNLVYLRAHRQKNQAP